MNYFSSSLFSLFSFSFYILILESNLNGANHVSYQNGGSAANNNNNNSLGPQHIGGNIVLLATEPVEITHSEHDAINNNNILSNGNSITIATTDEELTPLHWLHDKNLLKGKYPGARELFGLHQCLSAARE